MWLRVWAWIPAKGEGKGGKGSKGGKAPGKGNKEGSSKGSDKAPGKGSKGGSSKGSDKAPGKGSKGGSSKLPHPIPAGLVTKEAAPAEAAAALKATGPKPKKRPAREDYNSSKKKMRAWPEEFEDNETDNDGVTWIQDEKDRRQDSWQSWEEENKQETWLSWAEGSEIAEACEGPWTDADGEESPRPMSSSNLPKCYRRRLEEYEEEAWGPWS